MKPHWFGFLDPDPHWDIGKKLDPDPDPLETLHVAMFVNIPTRYQDKNIPYCISMIRLSYLRTTENLSLSCCRFDHFFRDFLHNSQHTISYKIKSCAVWKRECREQWSRSMTFWCGSGSADPCIWLMNPDPAIFVIELQDVNKKRIKKSFFCLLLFERIFTLFFKDKKSRRSHKTVGIKVFRIYTGTSY